MLSKHKATEWKNLQAFKGHPDELHLPAFLFVLPFVYLVYFSLHPKGYGVERCVMIENLGTWVIFWEGNKSMTLLSYIKYIGSFYSNVAFSEYLNFI